MRELGEVNFNTARKLAVHFIKSGASVFIQGPPGVGKSTLAYDLAANGGKELWGIEGPVVLKEFRATNVEPVDIRGLPTIEEGKTKWIAPDFLPRDSDGKHGILFIDELTSAPKGVQVALFQLILDRRIGEYRVPEGWVILAAGNRAIDATVNYAMPAPLVTRFCHISLAADVDSFISWGTETGRIMPEVMQAILFDPAYFCQEARNSNTFGNPRTWEMLSKLLMSLKKEDPQGFMNLIQGDSDTDKAYLRNLTAGVVGPEAAASFISYMTIYRGLPSIQSIFDDPRGVPVSHIPGNAKAPLTFALANGVARQTTPAALNKGYDNALIFLERIGSKEIKAAFVASFEKWCPKDKLLTAKSYVRDLERNNSSYSDICVKKIS